MGGKGPSRRCKSQASAGGLSSRTEDARRWCPRDSAPFHAAGVIGWLAAVCVSAVVLDALPDSEHFVGSQKKNRPHSCRGAPPAGDGDVGWTTSPRGSPAAAAPTAAQLHHGSWWLKQRCCFLVPPPPRRHPGALAAFLYNFRPVELHEAEFSTIAATLATSALTTSF